MADFITMPYANSLSRATEKGGEGATQRRTQGYPCSVVKVVGAIITVKFEVQSRWVIPTATMPLFGPEYIRYPIQVGDKGYAMSADTTLGNMSGLGPVTAPRVPDQAANLTSLVFMPIGNINWSAVDPQAVTIYGPNGVVMRDTHSGAVVTLLPSSITCKVGNTTFVMNGSSITATTQTFTINAPTIMLNGQLTQGTPSGGGSSYAATLQGPLTVVNDVTAGTVSLENHVHPGVQAGSSSTGKGVG